MSQPKRRLPVPSTLCASRDCQGVVLAEDEVSQRGSLTPIAIGPSVCGRSRGAEAGILVDMSHAPELLVANVGAWRSWLSRNHATSSGVRLVLARKGVTDPTRLTYNDALPEAICYG